MLRRGKAGRLQNNKVNGRPRNSQPLACLVFCETVGGSILLEKFAAHAKLCDSDRQK